MPITRPCLSCTKKYHLRRSSWAGKIAVNLGHSISAQYHIEMLDRWSDRSRTIFYRFATGPALYNSDALIQEFYSKEAPNSVS